MHLVPNDRRSRRMLEGERVCEAIDAIRDPTKIATWAELFSLLGDQNRLRLLLSINRAGPISVTDLAVATDLHDTTVSQSLRLLRAAGAVVAHRDGRIVRYELANDRIRDLLVHAESERKVHHLIAK